MVTHQLQVERRTGKVRQSEADVLPLCHATNLPTEFFVLQRNSVRPRFRVFVGSGVMLRRDARRRSQLQLTLNSPELNLSRRRPIFMIIADLVVGERARFVHRARVQARLFYLGREASGGRFYAQFVR